NPVVILPGAAAARATDIANEYAASLTLGAGQFCTNPGLLFAPNSPELLAALRNAVGNTSAGPLLSERIRDSYVDSTAGITLQALAHGTAADGAWSVTPQVWRLDLDTFTAQENLHSEIFGPAGLVITYSTVDALLAALSTLDGSLT